MRFSSGGASSCQGSLTGSTTSLLLALVVGAGVLYSAVAIAKGDAFSSRAGEVGLLVPVLASSFGFERLSEFESFLASLLALAVVLGDAAFASDAGATFDAARFSEAGGLLGFGLSEALAKSVRGSRACVVGAATLAW